MDKAMIRKYLAEAEKHVGAGDRHIASQLAIIARLEAIGADTTVARQILQTFEDLQSLHIEDRDRIAAELARSEQE